MPRDKKPSYWTNHLRVVYDDTIPMSRRLTALGLQSGLSGVAGFALGTVCGAIPRAVEAVVTSRRRTNPIPPLRLIGLGALANGALLGIIGSTIGPATFLLHSCGMPIQKLELPPPLYIELSAMLGGVLALVATWPLHMRLERLWKAQGLRTGGAADLASFGLVAVGLSVLDRWTTSRSRRTVESEL